MLTMVQFGTMPLRFVWHMLDGGSNSGRRLSALLAGMAILAGLAMAFYSIYKLIKRLSKAAQRTGTRHMLDVHGAFPAAQAQAAQIPPPLPLSRQQLKQQQQQQQQLADEHAEL